MRAEGRADGGDPAARAAPLPAALALALAAGTSAQPPAAPGGSSPDPSRRPGPAELAAARAAEELLQAAFRGRRTEEAAHDLEGRLSALRKQPIQLAAPPTAMLLGTLAGIRFAAGQEAEGAAALRRLYHFGRRIGDEALFYAGVRRCLALPAFQRGATRLEEIEALEALRAELAADGRWGTPYQAAERFMVALLDCIGTGHLLDRRGAAALPYFREARVRGVGVSRDLRGVEDPIQRRLGLVCSRIFPLAGLVSTQMVLGNLEQAADLGAELVAAREAFEEGGALPADHPAREAIAGTLQALAEQYRNVQAVRRRRGEDVPATLEDRAAWKARREAKARQLDTLAAERQVSGEAAVSPFVSGP